MKTPLLIITLLLLFSARTHADDAAEPITEYGKVVSLKDAIVIDGRSDLGGIKTAKGEKIDVWIREATSGDRKAGAVIIDHVNGSNLVDLDEIPSLLAAIDALLKLDKTASRLDDCYAFYVTHSGLRVDKFTSTDDKPEFSFAGVVMSAKELADTRDLVAQAQAKLKSL
jgi:hypothetical protein